MFRYITLLILISSFTYNYYRETELQLFRILSGFCLVLFYLLVIVVFLNYLRNPKKILTELKIFIPYTILICIILLQSIVLNEKDITTLFLNPYSFSAFFISVIVFFIDDTALNTINKISRYIIYWIPVFTIFEISVFGSPFSLISFYTTFFFVYLFAKSKLRNYVIICLLISSVLMWFFDYRSGVLIIFAFFALLFFSRIFVILRSKISRFVILVGTIVISYFLFFNFTEFYGSIVSIFNDSNINTIDTRSFLLIEFFQDIKGGDLFFGRGYLGTYFSPYFLNLTGEGGDHYIRFSAEIGYLQIILKGGVLLLFAFLIVSFRSIYRGFIRTTINQWQYLASGWLLIEITMLVIENRPFFGSHYFFIWVLIGTLSLQYKKL